MCLRKTVTESRLHIKMQIWLHKYFILKPGNKAHCTNSKSTLCGCYDFAKEMVIWFYDFFFEKQETKDIAPIKHQHYVVKLPSN